MADTFEKITIDQLTPSSASVRKQIYVMIDSEEQEVGLPHRRAYVNNPPGRSAVEAELPEPYRSAIFAVWGEGPTVNDSSFE
jgi:hypothetical protein